MITKMQDDIRYRLYPYLYQMIESPKTTSERFGSILERLVDKDDREGGGREMGEFFSHVVKIVKPQTGNDKVHCWQLKPLDQHGSLTSRLF